VRAEDIVYLDNTHQQLLIRKRTELTDARLRAGQPSGVKSSSISSASYFKPVFFRAFVVTPLCIFELVPTSLPHLFRSLTVSLHSIEKLNLYSNNDNFSFSSFSPSYVSSQNPLLSSTSASSISSTIFQCLSLISAVDYEEKEEQDNNDKKNSLISGSSNYLYAVEVLLNRGREDETGWEVFNQKRLSSFLHNSSPDLLSPILGSSSFGLTMSPVMSGSPTSSSPLFASVVSDNADSYLYSSHPSSSVFVPVLPHTSTTLQSTLQSTNLSSHLFNSLTPFLQYITLKRSLLFYTYHFRLAFSLLNQNEFTLAFYHLLLSTADCFTSLTIFPSLIMSSPFLLRCLFRYYERRDIDRNCRKKRSENYLQV
jgi:hypothetical protein